MDFSKKQPQKVAKVEKNFIYECEICFQDYDNKQHKPMIICSNFHAICLQCVNSNLFKTEYNDKKNPTGRYMCSKCSEIIDKKFIREHHILKEVCNYIGTIRQRDQEARKEFYNYVGSMGMNLVAMREDFDSIEKNNILLKRQNEQLVKENCKVRQDYAKIQKAAGAYEQLEKVMRQVDQAKETLEFQKVKLQSLTEQLARTNNQIKLKKDECLNENQRFFEVQAELSGKRQELKKVSKKSLQLIQQNEGAINLKEYLEQQINNLQNLKTKLAEQNLNLKKKIDSAVRKMKNYWDSLLDAPFEGLQIQKQPHQNDKILKKVEEKPVKQIYQKPPVLPYKKQSKNPIEEYEAKQIAQFDSTQKSIKNFFIQSNTVTLTNSRLSSFTHISFTSPFDLTADHSFTIKINRLSSRQIIIGLMTPECKNKKNIYNKAGFYGFDGWSKMWVDGRIIEGRMAITQGDQVKVSYIRETNLIVWESNGDKKNEIHRFGNEVRQKKLYPVVMLIDDEDQFEVLSVN